MVRAFLHAILMLLFSFFVLVNFYFLIVCVYLVYDFHNKYILFFALLFLSFLSYYLVCFRCLHDEIKMYIMI